MEHDIKIIMTPSILVKFTTNWNIKIGNEMFDSCKVHKKKEPYEFKRKVWNTPPNTMRSLKEIAYILLYYWNFINYNFYCWEGFLKIK
jgi:hypothetical protein